MKIHLGCGKRFLKGYYHVDCQRYPHVDHVSQINKLDFLEDNRANEIYISHAFEYFDDAEAKEVLKEWNRILKIGGKLRLSVPDFDALINVYKLTNNLGRITGPLYGRWENEDSILYHKTCYNFDKLKNLLKSSDFKNIKKWDPFMFFNSIDSKFDDYSKAVYPHMDFKNGFLISLNIEAEKI